jgi:hypothetical protein
MKSNVIVLSNISGIDRKYMVAHSEEKILRPADALNAMETYLQIYKDNQKKKKP